MQHDLSPDEIAVLGQALAQMPCGGGGIAARLFVKLEAAMQGAGVAKEQPLKAEGAARMTIGSQP